MYNIYMLLINELKTSIDDSPSILKRLVARKLKVQEKDILELIIKRRSLDCRKELQYVYSVAIGINNEQKYYHLKNVERYSKADISPSKVSAAIRPIIVGYGPAGIFCAKRLADAGLKPLVFERGKRVNEREKDVDRFFAEGILDENSNIQFGEGGAGTFSDAKLTTRIKDPKIEYITDILINNGADPSIAYVNHAHVGTDKMREVIAELTNELISKGVEFHFKERVKDFIIKDNRIKGIITDLNEYHSDYVMLGIGHSARDTIEALKNKGVYLEKKDISVGFPVEHPQSLIDENQYNGKKHKLLEHAEYFLTHKDLKGVYSFCMCPGGFVIPAQSEKNTIVTNGMSFAARDNQYANSAILIQKPCTEFADGFKYLEDIEHRAYGYSGSYKALSMNIKDYIYGTRNALIHQPSYPLGTIEYDFNELFTKEENDIFKRALLNFDKKIKGFIEYGIMIGPETRSSCPIRIKRGIDLQSINTIGLYPMGEGAGYGGGIMSCALDGIRCADALLSKLKSF